MGVLVVWNSICVSFNPNCMTEVVKTSSQNFRFASIDLLTPKTPDFHMFAKTVVVVCLLGLIADSDNCRAQSDNDRSKQRLPSSYLYSVLNGQKGDKTTFRDSSGRTQGSATQSGSRISIRDGSGRSIGSAETSGNKTTFRDASGRTIQTATTNGERTTFRSSSGSSLGTATQSRNNTTFRDSSGRSIGSASSSGTRTTFRDSSGRSSGSSSNNRR